MGFFDTRLWQKIRENEKLYGLIHNSVGLWLKNYRLRDRISEMRSTGLDCIFEVNKALSETNAVFFADFGSLLGFVRDGRPLSWDYDIDFGIVIDDAFTWEDLGNVMASLGYRLKKEFSYEDRVTEQTYKRGNVFIDFFFHYSNDSNSYYYVYYLEKDYPYDDPQQRHARITYTVKITDAVSLPVEGGSINVPAEYEQYLADVYGENWRIPDPNWAPGARPNIVIQPEFGSYTEYEEKGDR